MNTDTTRLGTVEQRDGRTLLTFQRRLAHAPETVWRAITEPEHLAAWFPWHMEGELREGAPMRFVSRDMGDVIVDGRMLAFEPPRLMEFVWSDDERLRFEIEPDGDGCVLTLANTFDEFGKAARDGAGWHACLDFLVAHLDGTDAPFSSTERWKQLHPQYVSAFGPDASTIGPPTGHPVNE